MLEQKNEQGRVQFSPELQQQLGVLNARINNANFAQADLLKEMDNTFKSMATIIAALQKENAELKAKHKENLKNPKTQ
jgi:hypothetical protein